MTNNNYKTEKEFLDKVENLLKECGCQTWREAIPDEEKNKAFPFRVDLIFYKKECGYIAVEAKNFRSLRQGGMFAKSMLQLKKYMPLHYFNGIKIDRWCITSPTNIPSIVDKEIERIVIWELTNFIKHFINYLFNISLLEFFEYDNHVWDRIAIDKNVKDRAIHINKEEIKGGGLKYGSSI